MRLTWKRIAALLLGVVLCALLTPAVLAAEGEDPAEPVSFVLEDWDGPSNEEMFNSYIQGLFYGTPRLRSPGSLAEPLGEVNYAIEQQLKAQIEKVAAGKLTSTEFVANVSDLDISDLDYDDISRIYSALLVDCTSSLYWHDIRLGYATLINTGSSEVYLGLKVARDYAVGHPSDEATLKAGVYEVDNTDIQRANGAVANVREIFERYAGSTDVNKLRGYMYEICRLNVYNDDAAHFHGSDISFGIDPWQLVYVFDGDPKTNVVCEGYSKAFEYLCDNTDFNSSLIRCYCVSGYVYNTPTMGHMWNVIRMDDGDNYVIDVTWSEPDNDYAGNPTVSDYAMFLSYLVSGNIHDAYVLSGVSGNRNYFLGNTSSGKNMLDIYTEAELAISDHAYAGPHTHTAGEAVTENIVDPTCTQPGSYDEVICCSVCGHEMSRTKKTVAPLGHTAGEAAAENAVDPTCTEAGHHDEVVRCTVCQAELSRTPVTDAPALGHSPGEAVRENETAPTCTQDGHHDEVTYCTRCGVETGRATVTDPALGHENGEAVRENETAPTCTQAGHHDEVTFCTRCGDETGRTTVTDPALGHEDGEAVRENETAPTCTQDGHHDEVTFCTRCGVETGRTTVTDPALGHENGEAVRENETAPTCTQDGHHDDVTYCTRCGAETGRTTVTDPAPGHEDGEPVRENETAPTCTQDGCCDLVTYCTRCGQETHRTHQTELPAMGHAPGQPVRENEVPATYDAPGSYEEVIYCTRCHEPLSRTSRTIPVLIPAPVITSQPANVKAVVNKTATFSVAAQGTGLHYQWYVQTKGSAAWALVGGDSARLTVTAAAALDGARYRCVVTGEGGKTATSNEVTLTVVTVPKITAQPKKASVKAGKKVTFKVKASGYDLTYQWYYQKPGAKKWVKIKNAVKPSYSFKAGRSKNGYKYRCYVTNPAGTVKSKTAKLTVK